MELVLLITMEALKSFDNAANFIEKIRYIVLHLFLSEKLKNLYLKCVITNTNTPSPLMTPSMRMKTAATGGTAALKACGSKLARSCEGSRKITSWVKFSRRN